LARRRVATVAVEIRVLGADDAHVLRRVAPGVFDYEVDEAAVREFLADERHHIVVAVDDGVVVGFVSCMHYIHPDKPRPELWLNEVAVASTHRRQGIASALLREAFALGRRLGCREAWVLTEPDNTPALGLYASAGGERKEQVMFSFPL